ncbi:hypothetical protein TcasGA2_TC001787 [Tribolium castaneum]|uniref:Uncharacterized protein n=1 Tax=Tribolium castaneum TaxID=7070 RepID=D7EKW2_TRICA|nr:hypothetical protein TcasGA2_TC001787 [Tribolium castaneum]
MVRQAMDMGEYHASTHASSRDPRNTVHFKEQLSDPEGNLVDIIEDVRRDSDVPKDPRNTVNVREQNNGPEDNFVGTSKVTKFNIIVSKVPRTTVNSKEEHNGPEDNLFGTNDVRSNGKAIQIEFDGKLQQCEISIKTVIGESIDHTSVEKVYLFPPCPQT